MKKAEGWFRSWTEKFCVMTNVGLLYYEQADDKPRNLIATIDAEITKVKEKNQNWVFSIKSLKQEIVFAAKDEVDFNEWMEAFKTV